MHVKIPNLDAVLYRVSLHVIYGCTGACLQNAKFDSVLKAMKLQKRGTGGVDTASTDGTFDISNSDRLGTSEVSAHTVTSTRVH